MRYGSLICSKKWLSDRPKCWGMLFEAEGNNSTGVMWKQGLSQPFCLSPGCFPELGKLSYLIWKRGFRAICWYNFFEFFQANRYYLSMFLSGSRVCHITSTIWSVTLQPLGADHATIPHMKGDWYSFHMRYSSMICYKRLLSDRLHNFLTFFPLVHNSLIKLPIVEIYYSLEISNHNHVLDSPVRYLHQLWGLTFDCIDATRLQ